MYSDGRRFHFVWTAGAFLGEHFQTSSSNIFIPSSLCLSWPLSCTLESFHGLLMQSKLALDSWLCSHILLYSTTEHFGRLYAAHFSSCAPMISIRSHRLLTILAYYNNHFLHFFSVNSCETHKPVLKRKQFMSHKINFSEHFEATSLSHVASLGRCYSGLWWCNTLQNRTKSTI